MRPATWAEANQRAGDMGGVFCRPNRLTTLWAPLSFMPAPSTRSTPIGRQQPAAQPATSTSVLLWSHGRMTRSEPSGPPAPPPASTAGSESAMCVEPLDTEVADETPMSPQAKLFAWAVLGLMSVAFWYGAYHLGRALVRWF